MGKDKVPSTNITEISKSENGRIPSTNITEVSKTENGIPFQKGTSKSTVKHEYKTDHFSPEGGKEGGVKSKSEQEDYSKKMDEREKKREKRLNESQQEKAPSTPDKKRGRSGGGRSGGGMFKPFKQFKNKSQQWIKDLLSENEQSVEPNQNSAFSKEEKAELLSFMKNEEPKIKNQKRKFEDPFPITEQDKQEFMLAMREMESDKPAFLDKLDSETPNLDIDSPDMDMGDGDGAV